MKDADRKAAERERKSALGMKWRGLWVYPEVWEAVRAFAEKANRKHERQEKRRETD